jgi:amino acid transporter
MEMAGFHARETRDPGRTVPRAIALAVAVTVVFSVLGSLFMAFVLPQQQISLVSGTMELSSDVLARLSLGWLLAPLALVVALGGVAHLAPWILGPAKGVATVAHEGLAPPRLGRLNRNGVPVTLLLVQGVGGSLFASLFLFVPSVSTSYWMLSAVTAQIIIVVYALMFAAVIRLRYVEPAAPRPYRIPGGLPGVWLVGGVGLVGCVVSFLLGFVPPSQLKTGDTAVYVLLLALATVVLSLPPFVFALLERRRPARGRPREA